MLLVLSELINTRFAECYIIYTSYLFEELFSTAVFLASYPYNGWENNHSVLIAENLGSQILFWLLSVKTQKRESWLSWIVLFFVVNGLAYECDIRVQTPLAESESSHCFTFNIKVEIKCEKKTGKRSFSRPAVNPRSTSIWCTGRSPFTNLFRTESLRIFLFSHSFFNTRKVVLLLLRNLMRQAVLECVYCKASLIRTTTAPTLWTL